jgi:hypothetical protein
MGGLDERGGPAPQPPLSADAGFKLYRDRCEGIRQGAFRAALQLMRNNRTEGRDTILHTCELIVHRRQDFREHGGIEVLRPMMIKGVLERSACTPPL